MSDVDRWPDRARERYELIAELDRRARQWIRGRISDPVGRQEIVDQATLDLVARLLADEPPKKPWAWLCTALSRFGGTTKGGRMTGVGELDVLIPAPEEPQTQATSAGDPEEAPAERLRAWLEENLEIVLASARLTSYQEAVVRNVLIHREFVSAARSLGTDPSSVRVAWRRALAKFSSGNPWETPGRRSPNPTSR
jgi:DNA-directed RNA polymerase specialized sigma24 family protein